MTQYSNNAKNPKDQTHYKGLLEKKNSTSKIPKLQEGSQSIKLAIQIQNSKKTKVLFSPDKDGKDITQKNLIVSVQEGHIPQKITISKM